jgi:hypothetical protein
METVEGGRLWSKPPWGNWGEQRAERGTAAQSDLGGVVTPKTSGFVGSLSEVFLQNERRDTYFGPEGVKL